VRLRLLRCLRPRRFRRGPASHVGVRGLTGRPPSSSGVVLMVPEGGMAPMTCARVERSQATSGLMHNLLARQMIGHRPALRLGALADRCHGIQGKQTPSVATEGVCSPLAERSAMTMRLAAPAPAPTASAPSQPSPREPRTYPNDTKPRNLECSPARKTARRRATGATVDGHGTGFRGFRQGRAARCGAGGRVADANG
jgi:hypothetical protein